MDKKNNNNILIKELLEELRRLDGIPSLIGIKDYLSPRSRDRLEREQRDRDNEDLLRRIKPKNKDKKLIPSVIKIDWKKDSGE